MLLRRDRLQPAGTRMTPREIQRLRQTLQETTEQFGARFERSGRTVEQWEQGRRTPDPLVLKAMRALTKRQPA
jgi:DNA-binding transcriptional regulator YiaG